MAIAALAVLMPLVEAVAQEAGPLLPHVGGRIATAFSNTYGADSESELIFTAVTASMQSVQYASTRGLRAFRDIRRQDIESSSVYVLGYSDSMPRVLPGTTSLGVSAATLEELRTTGRARLSLIYDAAGSRIDGDLTLVDKLHYDPAGVMEIGRRYASVLPLTTTPARSTGGLHPVPEPSALALLLLSIAGTFAFARR